MMGIFHSCRRSFTEFCLTENFKRIFKFHSLFLIMMLSSIKTAASPACWIDSYPRDAGSIPGRPADCPEGYTNMGLTCYRGPETIVAGSVVANCPSGYTNMGYTCYRFPYSLNKDYMTCPAGYFQSALTARCHKICPEGYTNTGEFCQRDPSSLDKSVMTCHDDEVKGGIGDVRCYPKSGDCGPDGEKYGALCYKKCRPHFTGVGPVCWGQCPSSLPYSCGGTCVKNAGWCSSVVIGQVMAVGQLCATVATAGLAAATNATILNGFRIANIQSVFGTILTNWTVINSVPALMSIIRVLRTGFGVSAQEGDSADPLTTADIIRLTFNVASWVDITGFSNIISSYAWPMCSTQHDDPVAKHDVGFCYADPNQPSFYVLKAFDKPGWGPKDICHAIDGTFATYGEKPCIGGTEQECLEAAKNLKP